jgi:uncharacterized protein (TIGR03000 family)
MSRNRFVFLGIILVAGAVLLFLPGTGNAAGGGHGGGGGHPGGGGGHPGGGGFHGDGHHGGGYYGGFYGGYYGWGYPYYYGGYGIGLGYDYGYYDDVYRPTIINVVPYSGDPVIHSSSAYGPPAKPAPAEDRAYLTIQLPADQGEVWIEGEKTAQSKGSQEYVSPQLTPGKKYYYEVRAKWTVNGKQIEAKRSFPIYAGKPVLVDFTESPEPPSDIRRD